MKGDTTDIEREVGDEVVLDDQYGIPGQQDQPFMLQIPVVNSAVAKCPVINATDDGVGKPCGGQQHDSCQQHDWLT